ncbi:MAG: sodium:proton antiporter [Alphaproteobacteria bacterium]|jgi:monovalent cation:H+ antiporter, CPA1 family|nr:sodium:proton antiporter [Alphaproteobacteria bacterium]
MTSLSLFDVIAVLLVLSAAFSWINHTVFKLPQTIGLLAMSLVASLVLIALELAMPNLGLYDDAVAVIRQVDFEETVLNGLLAFLLFAGALHVDFNAMKSRLGSITVMATLGVLISTMLVGSGFWLLAALFGVPMPFAWALVFGALISPTDPVAVLSTLKTVAVPKSLETVMTGESLFNDGVGVVLFTVLLAAAVATGSDGIDLVHVGELFLVDAVGGGLLGLVTGYLAYRAMRAIDDYPVEVLISLALVTGTYALATKLNMSGPIAVVVAGILVGNRGPVDALSEQTQRFMFGFWTLIDDILNSVLFLLIGLEVLVLRFDLSFLGLAIASIPLALLARLLSVGLPVLLIRQRRALAKGTVRILTWGGLRGGISVALALALPESDIKTAILAATYAIVVFTIIVQGLTLAPMVRRIID